MKADLVISSDRLFDGHRLVEGATVVVEGERIAAVYANGEPTDLPEAEHLHSRFLMPGLIDSHLHLWGFAEGPPGGAPFALVENYMRLLTCNGITTVRDAGNAIETTRYCQDWGAAEAGPRVVPTGPLLDAPPLLWPFSRIIRDPEAARREVYRLHVEGMAWISLYHNVTLDVAKAAVEAAREYGLDVAAAVNAVPTQSLLEVGVTSLEHAHNLLFNTGQTNGTPDSAAVRMRRWSTVDLQSEAVERLTQTLLEQNTFVCPTLLFTRRWCSIDEMVHEPNLEYMVAVMPFARNLLRMRQNAMGMMIGKRYLHQHLPIPKLSRSERKEVDAGLDKLKAIVGHLHEAGVPIVAGTDAPSPSIVPGFSLHQEMALLVESGLSPAAVLTSATANAARLLRCQDELGCVKPGALADLLLIDGDPTTCIDDTRNIQTVIKGGRKVDRKTMFDAVRGAMDVL